MASFTSVDRHKLQQAFAIAHRASEAYDSLNPKDARDKFKAIADLIWKAHGEVGNPPKGSGKALLEVMGAVDVARK